MIVTSTAATTPPLRADQIGGVAQELVGGRTAPARITRRKMHTDIAGPDRAQQRVGQCMEPDIGVGMTDETCPVRDLDPANEYPIARPESMDVEALTNPHIAQPGSDQTLGNGEILGMSSPSDCPRCR